MHKQCFQWNQSEAKLIEIKTADTKTAATTADELKIPIDFYYCVSCVKEKKMHCMAMYNGLLVVYNRRCSSSGFESMKMNFLGRERVRMCANHWNERMVFNCWTCAVCTHEHAHTHTFTCNEIRTIFVGPEPADVDHWECRPRSPAATDKLLAIAIC